MRAVTKNQIIDRLFCAVLLCLSFQLSASAQLGDTTSNISVNSRDKLKLDEYGGQLGLGFRIFDGFGPVLRYNLNAKNAFEASVGVGATSVPTEDDVLGSNPFNTEIGPELDLAYHLMGKRHEKTGKNKVKSDGLALHAGHLFGDFSTSFLSAGWTQETFRKDKPMRSFNLELGLKFNFPHWSTNTAYDPWTGYETGYSDPLPVIPYFRLHWNWFLKKMQVPARLSDPAVDSGKRPAASSSTSRSLGFVYGLGLSKAGGDFSKNFVEEYKAGFISRFGLRYEQSFSPKAAFVAELGLSDMGYALVTETQNNGNHSKNNATSKWQYLAVPLAVKFNLTGQEAPFDFYLSPGLTFGYLLSKRTVTNSFSKTELLDTRTHKVSRPKLSDGLKFDDRLDAGLHLSAGIDRSLWKGVVSLETRYYLGLLDLNRYIPGQPGIEIPKQLNRQWSLSLGYSYLF
jgi:hypothetical protein